MSLFADDMILYTENPTRHEKITGIHKFSKIAGYKLYRNQLHFYIPKTTYQKVKKTVSFTIA